MSSDTPTPRTDAKAYSGDWEEVVSADFARTLEHELEGYRKDAFRLAHRMTIMRTQEDVDKRDAAIRIACETLEDIRTAAHCIAKAGPLNTPTLVDAWVKFMDLEVMAVKGLSAIREAQS